MSPWILAALAFVVGLAVGAAAMALRRRSSETEQRFRRLRREFDQYQSDVALHFSQAAEALTRLRAGFDQLYQEIQGSAGSLVGEESWQRRLRQLEPNGPAGGERSGPAAPPPSADAVRGDRPTREGVPEAATEDPDDTPGATRDAVQDATDAANADARPGEDRSRP